MIFNSIPWQRYALIVFLTEKVRNFRQQFGKTALEKLIYLLQEIFDVPIGYQYSLYFHGPFSSGLLDDLDYLDYLGGVKVITEHLSNGYDILPSDKADLIKEKAQDFLVRYQTKIEELLKIFGSLRVKDLELCSTIVFVDRDLKGSGRSIAKSDFVKEIKGIKPHFSNEEIEKKINDLENLGYIEKRK